MQFSKPRRPLDVATSEASVRFSHNWPKEFSHKEVLTMDSLICQFNLRWAWSSESRGVSTSKESTGLICVKNQVNFWSLNDLLSLLFIRVQAQAQGNYTEGKRTSTSIDTSRTKRKHFNPFVFMLASNFFRGEISVVMLAFVLSLLQKTRLNLLNEK